MKKKIISLILVAAMFLSIFPITAFAGTTEFKGAIVDYENATQTIAENGDLILTYTSVSADNTLTIPDGYRAVADILVVGGGGAGGTGKSSTSSARYGNGGNGGDVKEGEYILDAGNYMIIVGMGGTASATSNANGNAGKPSQVICEAWSITADGGDGGSGDQTSTNAVPGTPTKGIVSDITGEAVTYGKGGIKVVTSKTASPGDANTGNGGQGGRANANATSRKGGEGGSGIVIIRITDIVPFHNHEFTYKAEGNKITATCKDGCVCGYDETPLQLMLNEDGIVDAEELKIWNFQEAAEPKITYYVSSDLVHPLGSEPTTAGNYVAMLTAGDFSIRQSFIITGNHVHNVAGVRTVFHAWNDSTKLPTEGNYYLTCNVRPGVNVPITGKVNLCLNGYVILTGENSINFTVSDGGELNFYEQDASPYATSYFSGSNRIWFYKDNDTLIIGGEGAIPEMDWFKYPWIGQSSANSTAKNAARGIRHLVIGSGVTNLPKFFSGYGGTDYLYYTTLKDIVINSKNFKMDFGQAMYWLTSLQTVTFAEGVETINFAQSNTFSECTGLTTLNLPSTLKEFNAHAQTFVNDKAFVNLNLSGGNTYFVCENNVLYNADKTELIFSPPGIAMFIPARTTQLIRAGNNIDVAEMLGEHNLNNNIQITLKHNKDGKTADDNIFYVGEMIKAEVTAKEGDLPDGLFYTWLGMNDDNTAIDNTNTSKIAGFETPDTTLDGKEFLMSPDALYGAVKITYFPSNNATYIGTANCRFAVCQVIDGKTKVVAYKDFSAKAEKDTTTSVYSYKNALEYIANGNTATMIKGEKLTMQELLGRCGLTHITCNSVTVSSVTNKTGNAAINIYGTSIRANQTATNISVGFNLKTDNCLYHCTAEAKENTLTINIIDEPQIEAKCTSVVVNNPADGYDYFIGQQNGELKDGKICFTGLTPEAEHIVRMQITGANGEITYSYAVKAKTTAHDFSDIRDNLDGTHSTYCANGCGECVDTAAHAFVDHECSVCHATESVIPEITYTIVIPKEVAVNSKGITSIGKPTVKDVENADGKIITYTAQGTDFTKSDDNTKTVKATYYTAYTDADNNTPLGTESITVYDGGYIAEDSLTALYVFISDDEWEKAENGTYHATVTYNFVAPAAQ